MDDNTGREGAVSTAPQLKSRPYIYPPSGEQEPPPDMSVEALESVARELATAIEQNPKVELFKTRLVEVEAQLERERALRARPEVRHAG